jgi:CRISPR/Cas system CMR subunit Cmr6 (Cas7 group RAMP superfamily)
MKFEIESKDKEKVKELLNKFIEMAKEEYEKQKNNVKGVPMPEIDFGYYEENGKIIFFNTLPLPQTKLLKLIFKPMVGKMEKNLKGFFSSNGLEVKIKFIE